MIDAVISGVCENIMSKIRLVAFCILAMHTLISGFSIYYRFQIIDICEEASAIHMMDKLPTCKEWVRKGEELETDE